MIKFGSIFKVKNHIHLWAHTNSLTNGDNYAGALCCGEYIIVLDRVMLFDGTEEYEFLIICTSRGIFGTTNWMENFMHSTEEP